MKFRPTQLAFGGARPGVLLLVSIHGQLASISQLPLVSLSSTSSLTINYIKVICKVSRSNSGEMTTGTVSLSAYAGCHPSFVRPELTDQKNGARLKIYI